MGDLVALFMVVRKGAQLEFLPQVKMTQLDLGAELDVPGEQTDRGGMRQGAQIAQHAGHARTGFRLALGQDMVKPENITLEEPLEVFSGRRHLVQAKEFADEVDIGAPGELDPLDSVGQVEFRGEDAGKSLDAGAARVDQRAVNVEENQSHHAPAG